MFDDAEMLKAIDEINKVADMEANEGFIVRAATVRKAAIILAQHRFMLRRITRVLPEAHKTL